MDNSQMVFRKVEDIEDIEENDMEMLEHFEYCEYCLGIGSVEFDGEEYECEYCYIIAEFYDTDSDDPDYVPDWNDEDTDIDTESCSDESDCGEACNNQICFCGSV